MHKASRCVKLMYEFGIFETLRGPIHLLPRTVYRIWAVCFPAVWVLVFLGRSSVAWRVWEAWSIHAPNTKQKPPKGIVHRLPMLSAVGAGLGFGTVSTTIALQGLFINDSFFGLGIARIPRPSSRRRFGRSGGGLEILLRRQDPEIDVPGFEFGLELASSVDLDRLCLEQHLLTTLPRNSRPFFAVVLQKAWEQAHFATGSTALNCLIAGRPCFGVMAGVSIWMISSGAAGLRHHSHRPGADG